MKVSDTTNLEYHNKNITHQDLDDEEIIYLRFLYAKVEIYARVIESLPASAITEHVTPFLCVDYNHAREVCVRIVSKTKYKPAVDILPLIKFDSSQNNTLRYIEFLLFLYQFLNILDVIISEGDDDNKTET